MARRCRNGIFLLLLAHVACGGGTDEAEPEPAPVPTIKADAAKVVRRTLVDELTVRGPITAAPNQDVKVSALVAGRVTAVTAAEGDTVRQGQVIAELDRRPLEDARRQATAAVAQAQAQVENARLNLQRNQQLFERGVAAGKEVEDARTQLASSQATLEQARATLSTAERQLGFTVVRAPIAGQVVKRMVSVGEQVDGTAAQPIVEIANLDRVELAANVLADELPRVAVGQSAVIPIEPHGEHLMGGTVIAIAPAIDAATNAAVVRIRIANPGHLLKVGMFSEARLQLQERRNVLVVPPTAIVKDSEGAAVYVVNGDAAERTRVTVGLEKVDAVEIVSGLTEGQTVLTSSIHGLGPKAKIAQP